jgi:pimeloyl-ACP methyl ester carboxylesterase
MRTWVLLTLCLCVLSADIPYNFTNLVDHFSASTATFEQRYYQNASFFKGPGSPIFVIMGGEGPIPPETGLFYPFVTQVLAKQFGALVIEPEHRYYGTSLPFGDQSYTLENLLLLNTQQALADADTLIRAKQKEFNCTARGSKGYCPVITVGGSYPGFLAAMMRLRYPAVVDIGYAASAPMRFYSQETDQYAYYKVVSQSAERASPGCWAAVQNALNVVMAASTADIISKLGVCTPLPPYMDDPTFLAELLMVVRIQFANLNMGNYPPGPDTGLSQACRILQTNDAWTGMKLFLSQVTSLRRGVYSEGPSSDCFDFGPQIPAGDNGTVACGDWSGCGGGLGGESWDYETCTFLVEAIGTNNVTDMFPPIVWSLQWLQTHCQTRFGVQPQPRVLADLWGFDHLAEMGASKIIFTNGLNDGWSAGGIQQDLSPSLVAINMHNGAHHSDLSHSPPSPTDTQDVVDARLQVASLISKWLQSP